MSQLTRELPPEAANGKGVPGDAGHPSRVGGTLRLEGITKRYGRGAGSVLALDGIDLDVKAGEFVCVVGASGCGKSTMLNIVAGLDDPTSGALVVDGRTGFMFQESALFPWLTVAGNIELAQRFKGVGRAERKRRAEELLEVVHLEGFGKKRPHELSGGMRQRVSLARTLSQDADILLMDEPFGALDAITRDLLHDELERLWQERGFTVVFVTHNVREAVRLADRIVLLTSRPGRVAEQFVVDSPRSQRTESQDVSSLAGRILERLRQEVARHGD